MICSTAPESGTCMCLTCAPHAAQECCSTLVLVRAASSPHLTHASCHAGHHCKCWGEGLQLPGPPVGPAPHRLQIRRCPAIHSRSCSAHVHSGLADHEPSTLPYAAARKAAACNMPAADKCWCAVFDAEYKNTDGIVFNKIIFISWCAMLPGLGADMHCSELPCILPARQVGILGPACFHVAAGCTHPRCS